MKTCILILIVLTSFGLVADSVRYQCNNCKKYTGKWWIWNVVAGNREFKVKLCENCTKLPKCSECYGRVASYQHADKRYFCPQCHKEGIFDKKKGQQIFDETRKFLKEKWGIYTEHKIYFSLEDCDYMKQFSNGYSGNLIGYFSPLGSGKKIRYFSGVEYNHPEVFRIRVLSGMSAVKLAGVIAHELTHDWVWEVVPQIQKYEQLNEGIATYIQWLYLKHTGNHNMAKHQANRTDLVYGAGFRQMQQIMHSSVNAEDFKNILLQQL